MCSYFVCYIYFTKFSITQVLLSVLDLVTMSLGIRLAVLAAKKGFIHLVEWLSTNLSASEDIFFEVNYDYRAPILFLTMYNCVAH